MYSSLQCGSDPGWSIGSAAQTWGCRWMQNCTKAWLGPRGEAAHGLQASCLPRCLLPCPSAELCFFILNGMGWG